MSFSDTSSNFRFFSGRHWKQLLAAGLAVIFIGLSIFYFAASVGKPIMGVIIGYSGSTWSVETIDPNGLAHLAGMKPGDTPVEVNGQPAEAYLSNYIAEGSVYGFRLTELSVVDSQGHFKNARLQGSRPPWQSTAETSILFLTSVIFWSIGLYVFYKRPRKQAAILLALAAVVFGLVLCGTVAGERSIFGGAQLSIVAAILGPWLLFHFFMVLPEERTRTQRDPRIYLIYVIPGLTIILFLLMGYSEGQPLPWFRTARLIEIGAGFLAILITAIVNFTGAVSSRTRQQMKIVAISCLAALIPFLILYLLPQLILKTIYIPTGYIIFFLSIIPLGMGYAVVTQKLLDIDVIIRRGAIYGLVSVIMTIILAAGIVPIMSLPRELGVGTEIATALVLGVIATVLLGPIKNAIEKFIDRTFYKDRYDYRQIIQSLSQSLNKYQELSDISRLIVGAAVRTLNLSGAAIIVKGQSSAFDVNAAEGSLSDPNNYHKMISMVYKRNPAAEFPNSATPANPDLAFLIPLRVSEKEIGFLFVAPKATRQHFSRDDIYLLEGLSSVAAGALRSAALNRDVSLRDTFVSIASHELRTPLTSIMGYTDLLLRKETSLETRRQWLKNIQENGQKITDMVDDLLNVTRIQSGKINLKLSEINIPEVINDRLPLYKESTNKHTFILDLPGDLPKASADRDKVWQIIGNLISNAIKYSPNGGNITIAARNEAAKNRLVVSVKDEGLGISPEDNSTLFKTFHRIQRPETRGIRGSGLGLYIVKEWAEAMGGEVWLESQLNKGSTFFVAFPTNRAIAQGA